MRDRINAGEHLGEIKLRPGQIARLAESPTQTGHDLEIVNRDGSIDELLQLKATNSMSYVKQALEKYPDIRVATTSEVDDTAGNILGTDVSNEQLKLVSEAQMGELGEDMAQDLLEKGAEATVDSIPLISMVTTGVIEGRRLLTGRSTLRESLRRGAKRMGKAAVYDAIGTALGPTGVAVPVVVGLRVTEGRITQRIALGHHLESKTRELRELAA